MDATEEELQKYWNQHWQGQELQKYTGPCFEGHALLKKYLPVNSSFNFLEIGCVPGNWMVYYHKEFKYQVNGVDYSNEVPLARATCEYNNVSAHIWKADAFSEDIPDTFDVVFSYGFIEHFIDWKEALDCHLKFLKPGGYLVLAYPNITHIHKLLMKSFHRVDYNTHCFTLMEHPQLLKDYIQQTCDILYFDYYVTFRPFYQLPKALDYASRATQKLLKVTGMHNIPNKYFSPYQWAIAQKK